MSSLPVVNLMNQLISVRHYLQKLDNTVYHEKTYSAPVMYKARVEIQPGFQRGINGETIPTYAKVYTIGEIYENDEITLDNGVKRYVTAVSRQIDSCGNFSHSEVTI